MSGATLSAEDFEREARRERFQRFGMAEWLRRAVPAKDYLQGHWLHTTARVLLTADTGVGKSTLALELAFYTSLGLPFLHWPAGRACRVVYLDSEMGVEEVKARLIELEKRTGQASENLTVLSLEDFSDAPPLDTEAGHVWLTAILDAIGAELVIIDNLMTVVSGSLKDDDTWKAVVPLAKQLSARRIGQLWVHHTGWDASRAYGSRTIQWQMSACLHLDRIADGDALSFKMSFPKARGKRSDTIAEYAETTITFNGREWTSSACSTGPSLPKWLRPYQDAFYRAMDNHGETMIGGKLPKRRGVKVSAWQTECERAHLSTPGDNASRARFSKAKRELIERRQIVAIGEVAWPI